MLNMPSQKTLYLDMDGVIVNFQSSFPRLHPNIYDKHQKANNLDEVGGIYALMDPLERALEAVEFLAKHFDLYLLSTAPWENPSAWIDKLLWVKKHLPEIGYKRLILSHNKHLNKGDYLIDDCLKNGADRFEGEHIHFATEKFPDWSAVIQYLCEKEGIAKDLVWETALDNKQ